MADLRFALFGAGFWAHYQLAGWREVEGVACVALLDRDPARAEALAQVYGIPAIYDDATALLTQERLDFVDICTSVESHAMFTGMVAEHSLDVICQKPMATSLQEAEAMVATCQEAGVALLINENFRWQHAIRTFKHKTDAGRIGQPFRGRITFNSSFPVFDNQPFLKDLEKFMLTDVGSHILDTARFLFGEAHTLYASTRRIHTDIQGEDVATVMMRMGHQDVTVVCEMSYASRSEIERFPETYIYLEGDRGFLELGPDFVIRETTEAGTHSQRHPPPRYPWADPAYDVVHASIVPCQANLAQHLRGEELAETTGADNLKTVKLVFSAYQSAASGQAIRFA